MKQSTPLSSRHFMFRSCISRIAEVTHRFLPLRLQLVPLPNVTAPDMPLRFVAGRGGTSDHSLRSRLGKRLLAASTLAGRRLAPW